MTLKSFGYYGTVGDQVRETAGAVNRLWVCGFDGDIATRRRNILDARVAVTLDVSECLFPSTAIPPFDRDATEIERLDQLLPDARERLLKMRDGLGDAWAHVDSVCLTDEPNLPQHAKSEDTMRQAATLVRATFSGVKIACIYYTGKPLVGLELMDWVGIDRYKDGDRVLWPWPRWLRWLVKWGWADHLQRQLRPDQELILVPGGGEPEFPMPTVSKWVRYAQRQARPVHIIGFLWRAPRYADTGMTGIVNRPGLREDYLAHGKQWA